MIIIDTMNKSLQIMLASSVATNPLVFTVGYADRTGQAEIPINQTGQISNITPVVLIPAPTYQLQRLVKNISVQNADTAPAKVTILYNDNGTLRTIFSAQLAVGDNLSYEDGRGFAVFDSNGARRQTTGSSVVASTVAAVGAQPGYQLVATRCGLNGAGGLFTSANPGCESRIQHTLPFGALDIYPIYAGFQITLPSGQATETPLPLGAGFQAVSAIPVAGGSGYAIGDTYVPTVAANQTAPTLAVTGVNAGAITSLAVAEGGLFSALPATGLAQASTSGTGTGATVTLGVANYVAGLHVGLETSWGNQTAFSNTNTTGVRKLTKGATLAGAEGNIMQPSGDSVALDPTLVNLPAGSVVGTRLWTPGWNLSTGRYLIGSTGLNEDSHNAVLTDTAWNGTYPTHPSPAAGVQPIALMGRLPTPKPSFAFIGDSISFGSVSIHGATTTHDSLDVNGNGGWLERAAAQQIPWTSFCFTTDQLSFWLNNNGAALRMRLLAQIRPSHAVDTLAINDFVSGTSFATLQSMKIAFWNWLKGIGVKEIWCPTCSPKTSSTQGLSALPTIASGGTGYAASSTFNVTISGGTQSLGAAVVSVTTNSSGVVTTVNNIVSIGYYTATPSLTNAPTGGTGGGLSLNLTFDGWLDVTSQSLLALNPAIQSWNNWLRGGNAAQYGVTRILDLGTDVESTVGSGIWPAGATLDGLHPVQNVHVNIAAHQTAQFATATL